MSAPLPAPAAAPSIGRLQSLRHLLAPARIRESLAVAPSPPLRNAAVAGLQASAAALLAVGLTHVSPWAPLAGFPALGALAALFGRFASPARRMRIVGLAALLLVVSVMLPSLAAWAGASPAALLLCLAAMAGLLTAAVAQWGLGGPGAVIFVFAASAALGPVHGWQVVAQRGALTAAGAAVAWLLCLLTDRLRADSPAPAPAVGHAPRPGHLLFAAARIASCAAGAGWLALAAGLAFPAWAAIGATAVLQGGHLHITMHRAVQRMIGTVFGAAVAGLVLSSQPSFWAVLACVALLQFATELVIGFNYVFGLVTVTPMALLMSSLTAPSAAAAMPMARVLDTALGALVGIAFALVFSSMDDRAHLAAHHARGLAAGR